MEQDCSVRLRLEKASSHGHDKTYKICYNQREYSHQSSEAIALSPGIHAGADDMARGIERLPRDGGVGILLIRAQSHGASAGVAGNDAAGIGDCVAAY